MFTAEMISKLNGIGKEWHKDTMHRFYINLPQADEKYYDTDNTEHGRLPLNRYERNNGKAWIELESGEFCTKGIQDAKELESCIMELVNLL